ncbi:bifunctional 3'-5' exonuclease/DNA polymerase [Blastococcus sp. TML/M2B]|uniref:bifunctional 3'-5' exonuclease/DNA polymerase n=1 Tax=unclassified Blastococcus TaxID=2619396 RepID=UPI00190B4DAC|nr:MULTISPECIES: bifunctional 3'-5' exonuclease/DNA polymerase [unclassified Blastococcus]MBN1092905.1 bifunctional 3'-5' exonuclease/DNA polymerase [Blastococcus sp. TML/M2B]MBN1096989.1 bifunctional 3'-5' exonuclease/DNA polymerase [Blastococcus sp. TML/C7B]
MNRIVLVRRGEEVELRADDGVLRVPADALPEAVAAREAGPEPVRWVWDDTTRWYPALLAAGVRVARCTDLRLCHALLRRSPFADRGLLAADDAPGWDALQPVTAVDAGLFPLDDPADRLDPVAEHERQQAVLAASAERGRLALLLAAESSGALVAAEMTYAGLPWRADVHDRLLSELLGPRPPAGQRPAALERLAARIRDALGAPGLNPDSPADLLRALRAAGLPVPDTRSWTLEQVEHPAMPPLLEYRKLSRLLTANGWAWLDAWVREGRFRSWFVPGGVVTGRWASNGGGALSMPVQVRPAAIADEGWRFVVADVAQLEPRVLAGMSGDSAMADAARGADLYQGIVAAGVVGSRAEAKVGMLGALYGATRGESGRMMPRLTRRYPRAIGLVEEAARAGERGEVVRTLLGRGSPLPAAGWADGADLGEAPDDGGSREDRDRQRRAWGRFTRNFVVQGTAAEWALCWLADLRNRLWQLGEGELTARPHLVFFLHDEVVVHTPEHLADAVGEAVREAAAAAGRLLFGEFPVDFPLDVSVVGSWADAG